ncbi:MAG: TIM-barrel domain-containing protein [Candidatus Sericytochromatia bacterium]|nr:TIM-barrel domain-containing protein [Candidatus Sericytochromatia bacterium]
MEQRRRGEAGVRRGLGVAALALGLTPPPGVLAAPRLPPPTEARLALETGHVLVASATGRWELHDPAGKRLLASDAVAPLRLGRGRLEVSHLFGTFRFHLPAPAWAAPVGAGRLGRDAGGGLVLEQGDVTWRFARVGPASVRVAVAARRPGTSRLALGLRVDPRDRLFGFGARTNACHQAGRRVENWVQEGGNGKAEQPLFGVSNHPTASHVPLPFCLSTAGFGLTIEGARRSTWEVGLDRPSGLGVTVEGDRAALLLDVGPTPAAILRVHTARIGRPTMPPLWAFGPTEFGKGGTEAVWRKARFLREAGVPASAIWYEDWVGLEHGPLPGLTHLPWGRWVPDLGHYPDVGGLNARLEALGFKSLGYFNPFLSQGDPHAREAFERGYALKDAAGHTVFSPGPFGPVAHLDPTHAGARRWAFERLSAFERLGFDGAMVDFGEWVPPEARFADGSSGWEQHNRYPDLWAGLHRTFWEQARPDGDFVCYTRAGWTGAARAATYMWAGDQNTDWGEDDGFPTALRAILSAGLSGVPLMTHDIAGFATLGDRGVTKELYFRWVAFGAFSTFMRTHSGQKFSLNWRLDSDAETLAHHRRYARAHMALLPYRRAVVREAVETGLPAMRHLWLAFPSAREAREVDDAYMLGPELLVAPVLTPGATTRRLWLPPGTWIDWWSGRREAGGRWLEVPAPLDALPVWVRAGAAVPVWPEGVMTAVPGADPSVPGPAAVAGTLQVRLFPGPGRRFTLAEGTRLVHQPPTGAGVAATPRAATLDGRPVALTREGRAWVVRARAAGREATLEVETAAGPWRLRVEGAPGPIGTLVARLEP